MGFVPFVESFVAKVLQKDRNNITNFPMFVNSQFVMDVNVMDVNVMEFIHMNVHP
jgi:hypothetical protein